VGRVFGGLVYANKEENRALNTRGENGDSGITARHFALFLAVIVFVSWPGIFLGLQMFVLRDFGFFSAPIAWHLRESFWHCEFPLWNPLSNCGQPFLAEWNTQALYPPALFYLVLPFPWSLGVFCLLHLFLGGLGMFLLARDWTQNSFGAALAGVIYAFSGLMTSSLVWPATVAALGWMPWVIWLARRAWREDGRMLVIASFAGALQMLTGGVEMTLLTWVLIGAMAAAEFVTAYRGRGGEGLTGGKLFLRFCAVILLITGLSAAQLLPFLDLLHHSERVGNYFASDSPMPPTGWVNFLVPLFRDISSQGVFFQRGQYWIPSYYTGVITVALAAIALWRRPRLEIWLLFIPGAVCFVLAFGNATPIYTWLAAHVGIVGLIRFPAKFLILPVFVLPLMAAFAVPGPSDKRSMSFWLPAIWLLSIGIISACLVWAAREPALNQVRSVVTNGLLRSAFFTAILITLFALERVHRANVRRSLQLLALVLVWLDLDFHAPQPPMVNPVVYHPNMPRPTPSPKFASGRAMIPPDTLNTLIFAAHQNATENFLTDRFALFSDCNLLDDIPKCDGFFPVNLREIDLLNGNLTGPMRNFLGVSEILAITNGALGWPSRQTAMPLLTGGQKPIFATDEEILGQLASTNFNPQSEVYLPLDARGTVTVSNAATVKVMSVDYSTQKIRANIDADAPAMLVAAQSYYHPWRAYVDGNPRPLWRANYAFQAFEIPAGRHEVLLDYVDWNFRIGLLISTVTLVAAILIFWIYGVGFKNPEFKIRKSALKN
jgi:hypothetical protein